MLRLAALTIASWLLASATPPVETGPGTLHYDGPPPVRFAQEGMIPVIFVAPSRIDEFCGASTPPLRTLACTRRTKSRQKYIIMPHPCVAIGESYALLLCHETAHGIGNWPGNHPL